MTKTIRIGTRESQLAVWQATKVQQLLAANGHQSELIYIKSDGDTNLTTPLYELGVQGIFTKALDIALLNGDIDIAVHSMKDVPTVLAKGVKQVAVLPRASYKDILVPKPGITFSEKNAGNYIIGTSSVRRKAQWLNKYPNSVMENLRGNVNTRLRKVAESNWDGAIFAAAGLERINLKPENAVELNWMLPAPAQGAIVIVVKESDSHSISCCEILNHEATAACVKIERDFLRALMGGCATPISALAEFNNDTIHFEGNILSLDGSQKVSVKKETTLTNYLNTGSEAAETLLQNGGKEIAESIRNGK